MRGRGGRCVRVVSRTRPRRLHDGRVDAVLGRRRPGGPASRSREGLLTRNRPARVGQGVGSAGDLAPPPSLSGALFSQAAGRGCDQSRGQPGQAPQFRRFWAAAGGERDFNLNASETYTPAASPFLGPGGPILPRLPPCPTWPNLSIHPPFVDDADTVPFHWS
jgi:hypothetical protein